MAEPFAVRLPLFEGPFDLLLFFIERDELDVHDIPIARITADFMAYLQQLEEMNVEVASEFIFTAATLMRIKAKLLLPRFDVDATTGHEVDPRQELVRHLLEYRRYKQAVGELALLEADMLSRHVRGNTDAELHDIGKRTQPTVEDDLHEVTLYRLLRAFERAMTRFQHEQEKPRHTVFVYHYTVQDQKTYLRQLAQRSQRVPFSEVLSNLTDRLGVVFTFIALLEMLQLGELKLGEYPTEGETETESVIYNQFWFERGPADHPLLPTA
jgi:segregation and condensation protein A